MKAKKRDAKKMKAPSTSQVRATISFPPDVYETLEGIAKEKKVSLAWVVRDAAEKYIGEKWPLFKGENRSTAATILRSKARLSGIFHKV